jgi:hypothetical protein
MTRRFLIAAALCALAAFAQSKPNFSGTWKLNGSKSDYGPMPAPEKYISKIKHEDPKLEISSDVSGQQGEYTAETKYTTDGKECANTIRNFSMKSTLKWDGDALTFDSKADFNGNEILFKDKWSVSTDGKTLTIDRHITAPQGDLDQKQVFDKQ